MSRQTIVAAMVVVVLASVSGRGASLVFDEQGKVEEITPKNLRQAAYLGDIEAIKQFLAKGEDINAVNNEGKTPLHYAIEEDELEAAKLLLEKGAKPNIADCNGMTALHIAAEGCSVEDAKLLLDHGASMKVLTEWGVSPLKWAVSEGCPEVARLLLERGADLTWEDRHWVPLFYLAAENDEEDIMRILLARGVNPEAAISKGYTPVLKAIVDRRIGTARLLVNRMGDVNVISPNGYTLLYSACGDTDTGIVKLLLDKGANPNILSRDGGLPLACARGLGNKEMIDLLLASGAYTGSGPDPTIPPYMDASRFQKQPSVSPPVDKRTPEEIRQARSTEQGRIAERDAVVKTNQDYEVSVAARRQMADLPAYVVKALEEHLVAGGRIDELDPNGNTVLHFAADRGFAELALAAIRHGANVNARNRRGDTPLLMCAKRNEMWLPVVTDTSFKSWDKDKIAADKMKMAAALIEAGADVNTPNENGFGPLHMAVVAGRNDMAALLLAHGANVNAQTLQLQTPLCILLSDMEFGKTGNSGQEFQTSSARRNLPMAQLLIKYGADVNKGQTWEGTPLLMAASNGFADVVRLLLGHGADTGARMPEGEGIIDVAADRDIIAALLDKSVYAVNNANIVNEAMAWAARNDDIELLKAAKADGASVSYTEPDGWTPLHWAARRGKTKAAVFLIANGANTGARTKNGETPADVAKRVGNMNVLKLFSVAPGGSSVKTISTDEAVAIKRTRERNFRLERGVYMNLQNPLSLTVLHGNMEKIRQLAGKKEYLDAQEPMESRSNDERDPNYTGSEVLGFSPLHVAVWIDRDDVLKLLLEAGANTESKDVKGHTPLSLCADIGQRLECAQVLLAGGADKESRDGEGRTVLKVAMFHGRGDFAQLLIRNGLKFDAKGESEKALLTGAVTTGDTSSVQMWLDMGMDVMTTGEKGRSLLHLATLSHARDAAMVKLLVARGADVNAQDSDGHTAMFDAISNRNWERVDVLLAAGADKTILPKDGLSPLFAVLTTDDIPSVKRVLDMGYDINQVNRNVGKTPIFSAVHLGSSNVEVIRLAIEHGASVESPGSGRESLLMAVCRGNDIDAVRIVMERTKDINYTTPAGFTALAAAVSRGADIEIVKALLEKGANPNISDKYIGGTPLDVAVKNNKPEVAELLKQYGGKTGEELKK